MGPLTRRINDRQNPEQQAPEQAPAAPKVEPFIPAWRRRALADVERVGFVAVADLSDRRNAA